MDTCKNRIYRTHEEVEWAASNILRVYTTSSNTWMQCKYKMNKMHISTDEPNAISSCNKHKYMYENLVYGKISILSFFIFQLSTHNVHTRLRIHRKELRCEKERHKSWLFWPTIPSTSAYCRLKFSMHILHSRINFHFHKQKGMKEETAHLNALFRICRCMYI